MEKPAHTVDHHFVGRQAHVRAIYDRILDAANQFGPVREEPKKTSIHLSNRTAFAGVVTRKDALILTLKSANDLSSPRIVKHEQVSAHRWHLDVRLQSSDQVDAELLTWIRTAFELAD
jgi:Domain of unknown function (DUF5655)